MARVGYILDPQDHPAAQDGPTRAHLAAFFEHLFPAGQKGQPHAGYAILAHSPQLALGIARLSDTIIYDVEWTKRRDLRELANQTLNLHFKCDFSFRAHLGIAQAAGVSLEQQAAIPYWRTSSLFNDEERLVIEYTEACVRGDVPEELFARVAQRFGDRGAVEFTVAVAWWSFWAMILNATGAVFEPERALPLPKDYASELGGGAPEAS
jgi:alkylhydroperoxidase family enzyme